MEHCFSIQTRSCCLKEENTITTISIPFETEECILFRNISRSHLFALFRTTAFPTFLETTSPMRIRFSLFGRYKNKRSRDFHFRPLRWILRKSLDLKIRDSLGQNSLIPSQKPSARKLIFFLQLSQVSYALLLDDVVKHFFHQLSSSARENHDIFFF